MAIKKHIKTNMPFREIAPKLKGNVPRHSNKIMAKLIDVNDTGFSCLKQACEVIMYAAKATPEDMAAMMPHVSGLMPPKMLLVSIMPI